MWSIPRSNAPLVGVMVSPVSQRTGQYWLLEPVPGSINVFHSALLARVDHRPSTWGQQFYRDYIPSGPETPIDNTGSYETGVDEAWIQARHHPNYVVRRPTHLPGQFHPRVWRNGWSRTRDCPGVLAEYPRSLGAARRSAAASVHQLLVQLAGVFNVVEPSDANRTAHGPEMRRVLLLACMEVEAALRGILLANGYAMPPNNRLTTNQYVELLEPMRLNEYSLRLTLYRDEWQHPVAPFANWTRAHPSASLPWYEAYNFAKHDREGERHRADLNAAIDAVAAACILLVAQFGDRSVDVRAVLDHIAGFLFERQPEWTSDQLYFTADEFGFEAVPLF
jgi:hypothetical protein